MVSFLPVAASTRLTAWLLMTRGAIIATSAANSATPPKNQRTRRCHFFIVPSLIAKQPQQHEGT